MLTMLAVAAWLAAEPSTPVSGPVLGGIISSLTFGGLAWYVIQRLWRQVDELTKEKNELVGQLVLNTAVLSEIKELLR